MENAADALKMAGAVLIFVLALSIIILAFGQVRETSDVILDYRDRETAYIDGDYYYKGSETVRNIGLETIIPSIYRAYLENYKIVFEGLKDPIYTLKQNVGEGIKKYSLDLETNQNPYKSNHELFETYRQFQNVVLANEEQKSEFLCGILYRDFKDSKDEFEKKFNIILPEVSLYDQLKNKTFTEYLGVYYQNDDENVPDVNKIEKRIITYRVDS